MSEKVSSGRSSPQRVQKLGSNSSRGSESSIHFELDVPSKTREERVRPSSWDDSDDDFLPDETTPTYSTDSQKLRTSVAAEIHELKKQFLESLQKLKGKNYEPTESETIIDEDRRQCPARVRRRTKSSSSLSPVLEAKSHSSSEKLSGLDEVYDEVSSKILDFDPKYYLNNFFNDIRMKRISLMDPSLMTDKTEDEDSSWKDQDGESIPQSNELTSSDSNENDERYCKTFRKLSQIIEVEENKKDLEKSSEETSENSLLFSKSSKNLEEIISPLQTARNRSEKNFEVAKKENFKSLSFEEFGNFKKVEKPFQGSLSERSGKACRNKPTETFSFLSVKSPRPQMTSEEKNHKSPSKVVSFSNQIEIDLSQESSSKEDEKENLEVRDSLKIDIKKNSSSQTPTPRIPDLSEQSRTPRTRSGKSRNSNPVSPKFRVNLDSARSLKVEDVNSPDSLKKITGTDTEPKTGSFEACTSGKPRSCRKSGNSSDRNLQIPLESSSLESFKSNSSKEPITNQKTKSTGKSQVLRINNSEINISTENYPFLDSTRSYGKPSFSRVTSPVDETYKNQSQRSIRMPNPQSARSSRSETANTPQDRFFVYQYDEEIPSSDLNLVLDIPESQKSSCRSTEEDLRNSSKRSSRRSSNSSLKSKNTESSRVTPRSSFSRSKESLENQREDWRELEKVSDVLTNRSSTRSSSKKSVRTQKTNSPVRGTPVLEVEDPETPKIDSLEERLSSGRSTRRSVESTRNSSPVILGSQSSEERKFPNVHSDIEKLYLQVASEIIRNKISVIQEDEDVKEMHSSQRLKSESESDRFSEKRLSIINEASAEDLEVSNESDENSREQSRNSLRKKPPDIRNQTFVDEQNNTVDGEKWNELIETFGESPNSSFMVENTFAGFPHKTETAWGSVKQIIHTSSESKERQKNVNSPSATRNKEAAEKKFSYGNEKEEKDEDDRSFIIDYEDQILEKPIKKGIHPVQNFQRLYYFNVKRSPFGMGECGDVTNWNPDKSDTPEKPKEHGDGMQMQKTTEVLTVLQKKEKEFKTQRHLWTDLKGDFRNSKQKLQKLFSELEDDTYLTNVIPISLKTCKSDNCIERKNGEESKALIDAGHSPFGEEISTEKREIRAESLERDKRDVEFDCETPRRSRSMIDLNTQLEKETLEEIELNQNFNSSGSKLFERASGEKESTNLNIFLARNQTEEKTAAKSNNWLNIKTIDMNKSNKKEKRKRKNVRTPKQKYQEYLSTGKSRSSIPPLKLRNPNCFQNFYKRIVSVFCLTSPSSVATSK